MASSPANPGPDAAESPTSHEGHTLPGDSARPDGTDWVKIRANLNAPADYAPASPSAGPLEHSGPAVTSSPQSPASLPAPVVAPKKAVTSSTPPALPGTIAGTPSTQAIHTESGVRIDLEDDDEEQEEDHLAVALTASPPWLISLAVHMVLIVVLGLLALSSALIPPINLEATFSESLGEQLEEETFDMADTSLDEEAVETPSDMLAADDPLASPHNVALELPNQLMASSTFEAPSIGLALSGREQGMKETLLLAYGGSKDTEQAVADALAWLKKVQTRDGSWRLDGPFKDGSPLRNPVAASAMALLAFQGAGFTHQSPRNMLTANGEKQLVDYSRVVRRGWEQMLDFQDDDGNFWRRGGVDHPHHKLYSHAQATIAICELYGMTKDKKFRAPAQRAVNYCCEIQDDDGVSPDGGWKYDPHHDSDLSVTGWFVMALQSARMAGLDVPSDVFLKVSKFLDSVTDEGSYYAYMPGYASKPALTAEGLLCRQYLGWKRDDPRLLEGVEYLAENPIDWSDTNTYYWYYATQVMHHMEGDLWFDWNQVMAQKIPSKQERSGPEKGSWSPAGDTWAQSGGRLYQTCLCTYMLEVYYRHLPIYSKAF